ncbi:Tenascin-R,Ryncolin-2,Ficolin-3,Ficolin-1-A,Fibrinogen C domain-containing protein 1,Tenascin-X,Ficolin-2,Ficolin-1,Fibrinogen-like protein A,Microfibril-associated glycoprotein 4,Ryncolin-3,Ryncolin-4 [Mytilus edulis]|uniref:Fibrinogen C-terminal domain-containing protein n=1 Tax=Mytilus edulis TaxID=6550 RepID=A0A8S3RTE0_MYTED|nr:Tenascin-R,Ryncolin-2,Ficolin-3,Ficolin-1-A,Fibrinogen C domain-containing protein 1,Tenascin-X,Ficolin-2,Ficolin-1,Fibrinogen-like protein A,Microfibril-associated glycoprotein 4,Ryncolin-3,Ryncolin-4 [Mytilus edulis]
MQTNIYHRGYNLSHTCQIVGSVSGNIVQVKWVKRPDLHGYTFTKSESFTSEMDSTADCARFCSEVPLCISFTFGNKICKGHNEKMHNLDSSITSAGMQYYEVSNVKGYIDCDDVPQKDSGIYRIFPDGIPGGVLVYCDMKTTGEKWTVLQRRIDNSEDFYRTWPEYSEGFGNLLGNFYLGNENIHFLTNQAQYELRVDLRNAADQERYALYSSFSIGNSDDNYRLNVYGFDSNSDAGDSLTHVNGIIFTTWDVTFGNICPDLRRGAWWYINCSDANLNGIYFNPGTEDPRGVRWDTFESDISLKYADIKIRRKTVFI